MLKGNWDLMVFANKSSEVHDGSVFVFLEKQQLDFYGMVWPGWMREKLGMKAICRTRSPKNCLVWLWALRKATSLGNNVIKSTSD